MNYENYFESLVLNIHGRVRRAEQGLRSAMRFDPVKFCAEHMT
jgi:hypothetical protein